jgi:hypothetical protein
VGSYPVAHPEVVRDPELRQTMTRRAGTDSFMRPRGGWYAVSPPHVRKAARARFPHISGRVHGLHGAFCRGYWEQLAGATECPYRQSYHSGASRGGGTFGHIYVKAWEEGAALARREQRAGEPQLDAWRDTYHDYCSDLKHWPGLKIVPADPLDPDSREDYV